MEMILSPTLRLANSQTMPSRKRSWGGRDDDRFMTDRKQRGNTRDISTDYDYSRFSTPRKAKRPLKDMKQTILDAPDVSRKRPSKLIDFSGDNSLVVALGSSVFVKQESEVSEVLESEMTISAVAWVDSCILVAAGGHVELWSPETSALDSILEGHDGDVTCCSFAGHRLATGGADGNVKITNLRTTVCDTIHVGETVVDVQWSPDGCRLAACTSSCIRIWGGEKEEVIHEHVRSISWKSPSILAVALADAVGTIQLYQVPRAHVLKEFTTGSRIHKLQCSQKHGIFVSHTNVHTWELWSFAGQLDGKFTGPDDEILDMILSKDESSIVLVSADETLRIFSFSPCKSAAASPVSNSLGMVR